MTEIAKSSELFRSFTGGVSDLDCREKMVQTLQNIMSAPDTANTES